MFLRRYRRTKNGVTHVYYALVESVRTQAGPRQRVVAHLGELNHDQERRWQRTVRFHNQQDEDQQLRLFPDDLDLPSADDPDLVRINLKSVGWANPRQFGDVWLALWLWKHLRLDEILERPESQQLVESRAEAVDVAAPVGPTVETLWRNVADGFHDVSRPRRTVRPLELCQSEIGDPHVAGNVQEDIGGLDVAVEHTLLMGIGEGVGDLESDSGHGAIELRVGGARQPGGIDGG
jgi:hypothetical protein